MGCDDSCQGISLLFGSLRPVAFPSSSTRHSKAPFLDPHSYTVKMATPALLAPTAIQRTSGFLVPILSKYDYTTLAD